MENKEIKLGDLRIWSTLLKMKKNHNNVVSSTVLNTDSEWLLISLCNTLDILSDKIDKHVLVLVEYDKDVYPPQGIFQVAVTLEELNEYFYILDRKREDDNNDDE